MKGTQAQVRGEEVEGVGGQGSHVTLVCVPLGVGWGPAEASTQVIKENINGITSFPVHPYNVCAFGVDLFVAGLRMSLILAPLLKSFQSSIPPSLGGRGGGILVDSVLQGRTLWSKDT